MGSIILTIDLWMLAFAVVVWSVVMLLKWKLPSLVGKSGERFVTKKLLELDPEKYKLLDNLMLPSVGNTSTTQIDHLLVSNYGLFCIETKTFSGWIYGSASQRYWTQVIYHYKKKFYNPLWQNYAHLKAIEALVRPLFPMLPILSYVAFPSADKLHVTGTDCVGQVRDIVAKIRSFNKPVLSDIERDKIVQIILAVNIQDKKTRKLHSSKVRVLKHLPQ